ARGGGASPGAANHEPAPGGRADAAGGLFHLPPMRATDEFPTGAAEWPEGVSRREFLRLSGASLALAGLGACTRQPREEIVPYVRQPDGLVPGEAQYYATAMELGGEPLGMLVRSDNGRPTKIEGNPDHP